MILDRLFPRRASESLGWRTVTATGRWSEIPGQLWGSARSSSAGVDVDEFGALTISAVFAAVNRLANIAAMLPIGIYERQPNHKRSELTSHPASKLLAIAANPDQTAFMARWFLQFWRPLFGAAVAEIGWDGAGRSQALWPLEPWRVKPGYDDAGQLVFRVDGNRLVAAADMIYVPHITEDGVCGKGFVQYAIESLGQAMAADQSAGRFFQNDMTPGGLLKHPGNPGKPARDELRKHWQDTHGGVHNRGKVGVLWGGWDWVKDTGMVSPDDAQLLETRQFTVVEVARWLNVPPHWLADLSRATFSNIEQQSIEALIYAVGPMLIAFEQEYDRKLLAPPRVYSKHNVNALLRSDMQARSAFYQIMRQIGVYSTNDILELEDQNGIGPEGDRRFVPVNWQPLDDLATGAAAQKPAPPAAPPVPPGGAQPGDVRTPAPDAGGDGQPPAGLAEALELVAEQTIAGFARKELNEARRASRKPGEMLRWMDGFYPEFEPQLATGLVSVAVLALTIRPSAETTPANRAAAIARDWVVASRGQLLTAMECKAEEWPNRSAALFRSWEGRAARTAESLAHPLGG